MCVCEWAYVCVWALCVLYVLSSEYLFVAQVWQVDEVLWVLPALLLIL